jgi:hypothetical protein
MPVIIDYNRLNDIPFFFVLGRPRSGTTLLRTLFEAHPNIATAPECSFIINMEPKYGKIKNWTKEILESFYNDLQMNPKIRNWDLDRETTLKSLMHLAGKNSFQNVCKVIYLNYNSVFASENVLWIADKNPVYATYAKRLMKIFPEAVFLHITRDPRDNILSIKTFEFEAPIAALLAFRWRNSSSKLFKLRKKYPEKYFLIRYEDLATEPTKYFGLMCDFLKIPFYQQVFEFYKKADERIKGKVEAGAMKFHQGLLSPINTGKLGLWKTKLPDKDVRTAETIIGKWMERYGYEKKYPKFDIGIWLKAIPWMIYARILYFIRDFFDILPYNLQIKVKNKGPLLARFAGKFIKK